MLSVARKQITANCYSEDKVKLLSSVQSASAFPNQSMTTLQMIYSVRPKLTTARKYSGQIQFKPLCLRAVLTPQLTVHV